MNRHFSTDTNSQRIQEKCLLLFGEKQIKTTMKYYRAPVRTALVKGTRKSRCCQVCRKKGRLVRGWGGEKWVQPLGTAGRVLRQLRIDLAHGPAITLLGTYPKETKPGSQRDPPTTDVGPRRGNDLFLHQ